MIDTIHIEIKPEAYFSDARPATPEKEEPMKQPTDTEPKGKKLARTRKALKNAKSKAPKVRKAKAKSKPAKEPKETTIKFRGELKCKAGEGHATGRMTDDGLLVLAGSQCVKQVNKAILVKTPSRFKQRNAMIADGALKKDGKFLVFIRDVLFSSPSVAACTVQGTSANGLVAWRSEDGKTLRELA